MVQLSELTIHHFNSGDFPSLGGPMCDKYTTDKFLNKSLMIIQWITKDFNIVASGRVGLGVCIHEPDSGSNLQVSFECKLIHLFGNRCKVSR